MNDQMTAYDKKDIFWRHFADLPGNPYRMNADISSLKCLFVYLTRKSDFSPYDYPISFGYMASLLRMNGVHAKILIQNDADCPANAFSGYTLICFYPMAALLNETLELAARVKHGHRDSKICFLNSEQHQHEMLLCSPHADEFARRLMEQHPFIDYVLVGEAEGSFIKLCREIATKNNNFAGLPACLYRESGKVKISEKPVDPVRFEFLPFPSRDLLENGISTKGINGYSPRIQSSRGCISPCLYCVESFKNITAGGRKTPWLGRDILKFVDEIELLSKHYKTVFFNIIDSSFEDPGVKGIKRMMHFCDEIITRQIRASFKIHLRVETINKLDDGFLAKLKQAGVDVLVIGTESGLERELKSYGKIAKARENVDNVLRLDRFGRFFTLLGHMMFSPRLRLEDLRQKVGYLKKINRAWDYLNMSNNLLVFRGTAYHDRIMADGLALECDKLSPVIPYRYEDDSVKFVADEMGNLKIKCRQVPSLNNLLYDGLNIAARYSNRINEHLWQNEAHFRQYKEGLNQTLLEVQDLYVRYFLDLVDLAESSCSSEKADLIYRKHIPEFISKALDKTGRLIDIFVNSCRTAGLSTDKLCLKTWMSLINAEINTSGGEVG